MAGNDIYTSFLMHCNGTNGGTSFPDDNFGGLYSRTATSNGSPLKASTSTAQSKFGGSSLYLPPTANSAYLTYPWNENSDLDVFAFTIDFWFYTAASQPNAGMISNQANSGAGFRVGFDVNGYTAFYAGTVATPIVVDTAVPPLSVWNHVAVVRNHFGIVTLYLNGVPKSTATYTTTISPTSTYVTAIGRRYWNVAGDYFTGYLQEIRISNYTARWTSDFSTALPATAYSTDAIAPTTYGNDKYTVFLAHCDGADTSTTFTDVSVGATEAHPITPYGGARIKNDPLINPSTFGNAGSLFSLSGEYLSVPASVDFDTSKDFSIDFRTRITTVPTTLAPVVFAGQYASATSYWRLGTNSLNTNLRFIWYNGSEQSISLAVTWTSFLNKWAHISLSIKYTNATNFTYCISIQLDNGVSQSIVAAGPANIPALYVNGPLIFGSNQGTTNFLQGQMDEIRISNCTRRSVGLFAVPKSKYGTSPLRPSSQMLLHFDLTPVVDSGDDTPVHTMTSTGSATISAVQSVFGGSSLRVSGAGSVYTPTSDDFNFGTGDFTVDLWVYMTSSVVHTFGSRSAGTVQTISYSGTALSGLGTTATIAGGIPLNTWHHITSTRTRGVSTMFLDGVARSSTASVVNYYTLTNDSTTRWYIGAPYNSGGTTQAYIDEYRLLKHQVAWNENFDVPTKEYSIVKRFMSLFSPLQARSNLSATGAVASNYALFEPLDFLRIKRVMSLISDLSARILGGVAQISEAAARAISYESLYDTFGMLPLRRFISKLSLTDFRSKAEVKLSETWESILYKKILGFLSDNPVRSISKMSLASDFSARTPRKMNLLEAINAKAARLQDLTTISKLRMRNFTLLSTEEVARIRLRESLKTNLNVRAIANMSLVGGQFRMSQYWSFLTGAQARTPRFEEYTTWSKIRAATHHDVLGKYDMNVVAGYHVWAENVDTLAVTQLGFINYNKGVAPSISGITLPPGTYDLHFKLQGFRWSDWLTVRKFRILVTPIGVAASAPPVINWSTPPYSFYPSNDAIYWVWNNLIGTYNVDKFLVWMSETGTPDVMGTPILVSTDIPRGYGYLWQQTNPINVAVAARYVDTDGNVIIGDPIYQSIPMNIYAAPPVPYGQFAYDKAIDPVDKTVYPKGVYVYSQSDLGVDGDPVYNDNKSGWVYVA